MKPKAIFTFYFTNPLVVQLVFFFAEMLATFFNCFIKFQKISLTGSSSDYFVFLPLGK